MRANVIELSQASDEEDFKRRVFASVGDLSQYDILGERVLVATYVPPERTKGGIIRPNANVNEARFSSPTGLVLKLGRAAFKYDGQYSFEGTPPAVGDFVQFGVSDAREFFLGPKGAIVSHDHGVSCRLLRSESIYAVIDDPSRLGQGGGFENLGG